MIWIARVKCPLAVCDGYHRLCWDDLQPPDPSRPYAYAAADFGKGDSAPTVTISGDLFRYSILV